MNLGGSWGIQELEGRVVNDINVIYVHNFIYLYIYIYNFKSNFKTYFSLTS